MSVPLRSDLSAEQAVLCLRGDARPFALVGDWVGGGAILGSEPVRLARDRDDPFAALESLPVGAGGPAAVGGGWVGWLGYGLGARIERLPPSPPAPVVRPAFSLAFYDHVVRFDGQQWWFEALPSPEREGVLEERLAVWAERLGSAPPAPHETATTPFGLGANGASGHLAAVHEARERIATGEIFQANVCLRLDARLYGDPLDLFARALPLARPRFGAVVDGVVSLSPERFLRRHGRHVQTEPIKGTRPRVGPETARGAARDALVSSAKDSAEHMMIVDLMRNDLGRVCEYGTITVAPPRVEAHAGVWHLVSTVSGRLRPDVGDGALLRATFPPGSVTGAPKIQAMKVIARLEATRRELYTGAIGIVSPLAGLDLSVAIRTFETSRGRIWFGAGGGIVADSDPALELAEALAKAAGPVAAIGGQVAPMAARPRRVAAPIPSALRLGRRPDPDYGVFETVLVEHGRAVALDDHVARLAASMHELYGARLEPTLAARARAAAAGLSHDRGRLRILADTGGEVQLDVSPASATPQPPAVLRPFALPGGLGAHKWRDRRLLEALAARAPGTVALLLDTDGLVLEAAYANVWILDGGALLTPPADGRILPGITRAELLAADPTAREEPIELARLLRADAIFLTSSIGRRRPARLATTRAGTAVPT